MVKFWMVYVPDGVNPPKKQYFSRNVAEKDAKKLSRIHGKSAYVLETASCWRPVIENVTSFEEPHSNQHETLPALGPSMEEGVIRADDIYSPAELEAMERRS